MGAASSKWPSKSLQDIWRHRHRQQSSCTFEVSFRSKCLEAEAGCAYYKAYKQGIIINTKLNRSTVLFYPLSNLRLFKHLFLVFFDLSRERNYISSIFR